jgi:hypothetical protein
VIENVAIAALIFLKLCRVEIPPFGKGRLGGILFRESKSPSIRFLESGKFECGSEFLNKVVGQ